MMITLNQFLVLRELIKTPRIATSELGQRVNDKKPGTAIYSILDNLEKHKYIEVDRSHLKINRYQITKKGLSEYQSFLKLIKDA